jgi:hypothetical protein
MLWRCWKNNNEKMLGFFIELTPYVALYALSRSYKFSWLIRIERGRGICHISPIQRTVKEKRIAPNDIPLPSANSIIQSLSWDFQKIIRRLIFNFSVPAGSEIKILFPKDYTASLILKSNDFNFDILFGSTYVSRAKGPHWVHPLSAALMESEPRNELLRPFQSIDMSCQYNATFNFPEEDVDSFNNYFYFAETIMDQLKHDLDYNEYIDTLPPKKIFAIESKVDEILKILKNETK